MSLRPKASALAPVGARPARPARLDAVLAAGRARLGAPTGEFYAVPQEEGRDLRAVGYLDPHTLEPIPSDAERDHDDATFRLPFPESAAKNADGSYKYRVYDAAMLWEWVKREGGAVDPVDRTPLLRSDWEELRARYSNAAAYPTPALSRFRRPITSGLWPPGVPYVPPPPLPPPPPNVPFKQVVNDAEFADDEEDPNPNPSPNSNQERVVDMVVVRVRDLTLS